ncbi:MAG: hypothetical protein AB1512_28700 [Thermodesulfobacteriota bacterium]
MVHDSRSPDGRHRAVFHYEGEFHWGPAYFRLELDGKVFPNRLFDDGMCWSDDSRFFAVQEWMSTDYGKGPVCRVLIFDTEGEKYRLLRTVRNGSVTDFRFIGHVFYYTIIRSTGEGQETSEEKEDLSGKTGWVAMVYGSPRPKPPPPKKPAPEKRSYVPGPEYQAGKEKVLKWMVICMVVGVFPMLFYYLLGIDFIDTSRVMGLVGKYVALPTFILCALVILRHVRSLSEFRFLVIRVLFAASIFAGLSTWHITQLSLLYNMTGNQGKVVIAGTVKSLHERRPAGRAAGFPTDYSMELEVEGSGIMDLDISREEYSSLHVGDDYSSTWTRGRLGYLFRARSIVLPTDIEFRPDVQIPDFGAWNKE